MSDEGYKCVMGEHTPETILHSEVFKVSVPYQFAYYWFFSRPITLPEPHWESKTQRNRAMRRVNQMCKRRRKQWRGYK